MQSGTTDHAGKNSRIASWGASLLNKLGSAARKCRKRLADKQRRQQQRSELRSEDQ